jgi:hypothetical protein
LANAESSQGRSASQHTIGELAIADFGTFELDGNSFVVALGLK